MLIEQIEHRWLSAFERTFSLCKVQSARLMSTIVRIMQLLRFSNHVPCSLSQITFERVSLPPDTLA